MKAVLLCAGMAAGTFAAFQAQAAGSTSLWPSLQDSAICDPIFARMERLERGTLLAQADLPKPEAEAEVKEDKPDEAELTDQLSAMLQACSYDGKALTVPASALQQGGSAGGAEAVERIMRFTGLPQNFTIMESDVPNAAAIIVMGKDGIPQRVIAYNDDFMDQVAKATEGNDWSPLSIMAHEIGHHLSGHTLTPGGSQPPTELEADKFSGFVLFKMGAKLADARKAIETLIPEADGPTHPGRKKRLVAVEAGWRDSCLQQREDCSDPMVVAAIEPGGSGERTAPAATPQPPAAPAKTPATAAPQASAPAAAAATKPEMPEIPTGTEIAMPDLNKLRSGAVDPPKQPIVDRIPVLEADATPSKFDRFVYDAAGAFDPDVRAKLQDIAFRFAAAANVEVVTFVTDDLQSRTADQFALDAMRQLRIGKMDVGNGAVLVVSPETRQVGVALGPGLLVQYTDIDTLKGGLEAFLDVVNGGGKPQSASTLIANTAYRVMRDTRALEWAVRYDSLTELQEAEAKEKAERDRTGAPFDPATSTSFRKLVRVDATVVAKEADRQDQALMVNEPRSRHVGPAMHVRTADGRDAVVYVNGNVPALMPSPLREGRRYAFILRDTILRTGAPQLDLVSYDLLE